MNKVQLVQLNNKYGNQVYLPYSVGILQSHTCQDNFISDNFKFYEEIKVFTQEEFPELRGERKLIDGLVEYQKFLIVKYNNNNDILKSEYDFHNYFVQSRAGILSELEKGNYINKLAETKNYEGDKKLFSREIVWYGRKGGKFFNPIDVGKDI